MANNDKPIKVVDRRMFTAEGDLREEVRAELAQPDPEPKPEAKPAPPVEPPVPTNQAFLRLLDMLAQTASLYLEGIPDPATGRRTVDLTSARQIIDSLSSLREKTRGRLSFEETDALDGLLGELQMVFARLASQGTRAAGAAAPPGSRRR